MNTTVYSPGVFAIMAEFKSYELQQWLDTTTPAHARALFELGEKLEAHRQRLLDACQQIASDDRTPSNIAAIARSALSKVS